MAFTYTYTARSVKDPEKVATFTILEDKLKIDVAGLFEKAFEIVNEDDKGSVLKDMLSTQSRAVLLKILETLSGPVHLNDIQASYEADDFNLTVWKRAAGLRLAPVVIAMGEVDNPKAAKAFISTLEERQTQLQKPGVFKGPLDYWFTWVAIVIGAIVLLRRPHNDEEKTS